MSRPRDDDSDTEINLSFNGASSIIVDESVPVVNQDDGRAETASKSESFLSSPIEGWDLSPDGIRTSEGLEATITESKSQSAFGYLVSFPSLFTFHLAIAGMAKPDLIPEMSAQDEKDEEHHWRSVVIMGLERKIDLKVIEPYKKVNTSFFFF